MSGYDLKKFVEEAIRFFWNLSYGTIYPMLKRMESYRDKLHDRMEHYKSIEPESLEEARNSRHGALSHATLRCGILTIQARIRWCRETLQILNV